MAQPTRPPAARPPAAPKSKSYTHKKPNYVSLKEGEILEGIFITQQQGRFGSQYAFKVGQEIKVLSGNRFQLDAIFMEMQLDGDAFPSGLAGHLLRVSRGQTVKIEGGKTVGQYSIEHIFEGCPHKCTPF